ncbi:MAG: SPW repeat protein [Patescibacteria group bacterium]
MRWTHWTLIALGIWLVLSPWILGFSAFNLPAWNNILMGVLIVIFSIWNFSDEE